MTTDRNSEWGTPAFYVDELRALRDALPKGKAQGVCNGAALTIEKLAGRVPAAEVQALVERWRALAASLHPDDPRSYSHALGVTGCADELAKLIPRGTEAQ